MEALSTMTASGTVEYSPDERCDGLCQEEQTVLQLRRANVTLQAVSALVVVRALHKQVTLPCGAVPLLAAAELRRDHSITPQYWPCPPPDRRFWRCNKTNQTRAQDHPFYRSEA